MTGASAAAKEHAIATKGVSGSTEVFVEKQKAAQAELKATATAAKSTTVAMKALSVVGNMLIFWAITEGIQLAVKALDKLIVTTEEAKEALEDSVSSFQGTTDELKSLESELETTADRLKELQELAENNTISVAEERELELLKQQNAELERKIALKKEEQIDAAKQVLKDAKKYSNKEVMSSYAYVAGTYEQGAPQYASISAADELSIAFDKYYSSTNRANANQQNPKDVIENMYAIIEPTIEAYEALISADYKLSDAEQAHYEKLRSLQDRYLQYRYDLNGLKETYQALSVEQQKNILLNKLTAQGLSDIQANAVLNNVYEEDYASLWEKGFSFTPPQMTDYATAEEYGKAYANAWLNGVASGVESGNETSILSFSQAWEQLKNSTEDATKGLADDLTKLAEAGQLTSEALSEADTSEFFKNAGISAEEATKQINALVSSSTQLNALSGQISKMSDMLADKKNGTVASAADLAGFDATVKGLESWEEFERVMGSSKSSMEECQAAANALATEWVNNGNFLANLTEENKQFYITQLDNMGVMNAEALVTDRLSTAQLVAQNTEKALSAATTDLNDKQASYTQRSVDAVNATYENSTALATQEGMTNAARIALVDLVAEQTIFSNQDLGVTDKIAALGELAGAYMGAAAQASFLNKTQGGLNSNYRISPEEAWAQVKDEFSKLDTTIVTPVIKPTGSSNYKPSGSSGGSGGSGSDTKQTIDWIERLLDVLQKKIDRTKAKFENLFTVKSKKNNLTKQITLTKNLLTATTKAADRYLKAANKVGLSDSLKKKVKNGSYDINDYSSEISEKIQKYENYYDKYKELKQQADELETDIRSLRTERYQLYVDDAEAKIAKSQAYTELDAGNYKKQNKHLEYQKKQIKEQYKYQIKIAKLNKDGVEVAKLRAELQNELNDLTKQEFDNIANTYDNKIGLTNNKIQAFQDQIDLLEARGQQVGSTLYTKQISLNDGKTNKLLAEKDELIKQLAEIPKGKDSWYEAQDKLFSVDQELTQIQIDNANFQKSINQLKFDRFDDLLAKLNDIVDETDFLIDMLDSENFFDDNGMITDDGITAMGLTAQNYDVYLAEAEKYKQMLSDIKDMYDADKISLEEYEELQRTYSQSQRDAIKSANDAKKAVIDYVKQGLDAQNDALAEAIEKQKELLESEKDLKSFQDQLADSNKTIAAIQKQINALESDNSEENRKKLQQLKADLADAQKDQEDLLYDRSISDQEDALDQMLKNSQEQAENYLKDSEKVFVDALNYVNAHTYQVSQNLEKISKDTGYDISSNITNAWKDGGKAVDSYESILQGNVPNITAQIGLITSAWEATAKAAEDAAAAMVEATRSNYLDYTSIGADKNGSSSSQSSQSNIKTGTTSVLGAASPVTGNILGGVLTGMQMVNKASIASFISNNKKDPTEGVKHASLNQYLLENYGGVLSKENEAKLADMLGVKISSRALTGEQGRKDLDRILTALKNIGFSTGGTIDPHDILKRTGEKGFIIANPHEAVLTEPQWESIRDLGTTLTNLNQPLYKPYIPEFQARNVQSPVYNIDNRVTVEGVATDKIVKDFENVATKQAEKVVSKINNITYAKGVRR